jgi:hypothetical protein
MFETKKSSLVDNVSERRLVNSIWNKTSYPFFFLNYCEIKTLCSDDGCLWECYILQYNWFVPMFQINKPHVLHWAKLKKDDHQWNNTCRET